MNNQVKIKLQAIDDVKNFVKDLSELESDVVLLSSRYVVNARSIMGIFSLNLLNPVIAQITTENEDELAKFAELMEKYKGE